MHYLSNQYIRTFRSNFFIALIILLTVFGIYIRTKGLPNEMFFGGDEGQDLLVALRIVRGEFFPLVGPILTLKNFFTPPTYYYFLASLVYLFNSESNIIFVFLAMNIVSIIFFAIYVWQNFGKLTATIFVALSIFSFANFQQSHTIWQPFPIPIMVSASVLLITLMSKKFTYPKLIGAMLFYAAAIGTYVGAALLVPFFLNRFYVVCRTKTSKLRSALYSIAIFTLILSLFFLPWFISEITNNFPTFNAIRNPEPWDAGVNTKFIRLEDGVSGLGNTIFPHLIAIYRMIVPNIWESTRQNMLDLGFFVLLGIITLFIIFNRKVYKKTINLISESGYKYIMLGLIPLLFYESSPLYHHVIVLMPFLFLSISYCIAVAVSSSNAVIKIVGLLFLAIIISGNAAYTIPYDAHRGSQTYNDVSSLHSFLISNNEHVLSCDYRVFTPISTKGYYEVQPLLYLLKKENNYPVKFNSYGNDTDRKVEPLDEFRCAYLICFPDTMNEIECKRLFISDYSNYKITEFIELHPYLVYKAEQYKSE